MKSKTILNIIAKLILVAGAVLIYLLFNPTYANIQEYFDRKGNDCELIDSFEYNGDTVYLYSTSDIYNYSFDIFRKKGDRLSRVTPTIIKQKRNSPFGEHINISFFIQLISNTPYGNLNPEDVVLVTMDLSDPETDADDAVYYTDNINYAYTDKYNECSAEIMEKLKSRIASASWTPSGRKRS